MLDEDVGGLHPAVHPVVSHLAGHQGDGLLSPGVGGQPQRMDAPASWNAFQKNVKSSGLPFLFGGI